MVVGKFVWVCYKGREKNEFVPEEPGKMGYTATSERGLRMGEWNNRRQWNMEVRRRRQTF
jgi:hypothetical protein